MKLVSFYTASGPTWGILEGEEVLDIGQIDPEYPTDLGTVLLNRTFEEHLQKKEQAERIPLEDVTLDMPIMTPGKILCVGTNYDGHIRETGRTRPEYPVIFNRFVESLAPTGAILVAPKNSEKYDYEGEFAVVIGKAGRNIPVEQAMEHVLGYSILQDGSVRDYQRHTHQFLPGKNFPSSGSFGPVIVTKDEFGRIGSQRLQTRLNGVIMQEATLDLMIFSVAEIISYISEWTHLYPGDVIATGTPEGVGSARDPQVWLKHRDLLEIEIDGIGILSNRIIAEN